MTNRSSVAEQPRILGTIKIACQSVAANCSNCGMDIQAWLLDGVAHCPKCNTLLQVDSGIPRQPAVLPFFHLPEPYRTAIKHRPTSLQIIPASTSPEQTLHQEFSRFDEVSQRPVCAGNGSKAVTRQTGRTTIIDCTDDCSFRQSGVCRASGRFLFYLIDISIRGLFQIRTTALNTANLRKSLQKLSGPDGMINQQAYDLRLSVRQSRNGHQYTILQLAGHQRAEADPITTEEAACAS